MCFAAINSGIPGHSLRLLQCNYCTGYQHLMRIMVSLKQTIHSTFLGSVCSNCSKSPQLLCTVSSAHACLHTLPCASCMCVAYSLKAASP